MSKSRLRSMHVIPWILATSGCAAAPFLHSSNPKPLTPDRMLAIARTFERQGDDAHARELYQKVLAADPNSVVAKEHLESLIASSQSAATNRGRSSPIPKLRQEPAKSHPLIAESPTESLASAKSGSSAVHGIAAADVRLPSQQTRTRVFEEPLPVASVERVTREVSAVAAEIPPAPNQVTTQTNAEVEPQRELPIRATNSAATSVSNDANTSRSDAQAAQKLLSATPEAETPISESPADENEASAAPVEMAQQLSPGSRGLPPELQPVFGPFKSEMLDYVREHHSEIQNGLVRIVSDPTENYLRRSRANFLLGRIGPPASDVVPALRCTMRETPITAFRIEIAETILLIQPGDENAIRTLLTLLREGDADTQSYAAFALRASYTPNTVYVVDALLNAAATDDCRLRRMVLLALGEFGVAADKAIPVLKAALNDPDPMTRIIAESSLKMISSQPAVHPVVHQISTTPGKDAR